MSLGFSPQLHLLALGASLHWWFYWPFVGAAWWVPVQLRRSSAISAGGWVWALRGQWCRGSCQFGFAGSAGRVPASSVNAEE